MTDLNRLFADLARHATELDPHAIRATIVATPVGPAVDGRVGAVAYNDRAGIADTTPAHSPNLYERSELMTHSTCSVDDCDSPRYCRGMCPKHYQRWRIENADPCTISDCEANQYARGWCQKHYQRWLQHGDPAIVHEQVKGSCSIEGCDRTYQARGFCFLHYERLRKYGDPLITSGYFASPEERFWRWVRITPGCWLWQGAPNRGGYGVLNVTGGERQLAHRFSLELHGGSIPDGYHVDHLCKVTLCVNPAHLEAVTPYENWLRSDSPATIAFRRKQKAATE